jgi:hypothetical protein
MRRFLFALAIALLAVLPLAERESLASGWCRTDPIISLNGHQGSIWLVTQVDPAWQPGTEAWIQIEYPKYVDGYIVYIDPGHGFETYNVWMSQNKWLKKGWGWIEVKITVYTSIPQAPWTGAGIEWANNASGSPIADATYGTTETTMVLRTVLTW